MRFSMDITRWVEQAKGNVAKVHAKVCLDLSSGVINDTPVKLGGARANWQPALNRRASGILEKQDLSGQETVANVASTLGGLKPGDTFTLMNNLPYIQKLENGSSLQAPNGMLKRNLLRFPGIVSDAVKESS